MRQSFQPVRPAPGIAAYLEAIENQELLDSLQRHLIPPVSEGFAEAAAIAFQLTVVGHADLLVEIEDGPALPAGAFVEALGLDEAFCE